MTSQPDAGKRNDKAAKKTSAASTSSRQATAGVAKRSAKPSSTTSARSASGKATPAKSTRTRKKKSAVKPAGPAVYASDVNANREAAAKNTSLLLASVDNLAHAGLPLPIEEDVPLEDRPAQVLRMAEEAFAMTGSWVVFYRTMLAPGGVVDKLYSNPTARRYFETTREFAELLEMVTAIRSQDDSSSGTHEPTRMITIRVPRSLHDATVRESEELELSINSYCVTKLLQPANPRFTPLELGNRRGRRAGPQMALTKVKVKSKKKSRASKG